MHAVFSKARAKAPPPGHGLDTRRPRPHLSDMNILPLRPHRPRARVFAAALALVLALCGQALALTPKRVLFVNSYHNGYAWSDGEFDGARSKLKSASYPVELQVEYLDARKHGSQANAGLMRQLFELKYRGARFDAIIVSDNDAFDFARENFPSLFPDTPVVFCGVNGFTPDLIAGLPNFTGVEERLRPDGLFAALTDLHPGLSAVHIVSDLSPTSLSIEAEAVRAHQTYTSQYPLIIHRPATLAELEAVGKAIPASDVVYYVPFHLNAEGYVMSPEEVLSTVAASCKAPIYTSWTFLLEYGAVGGFLVSGEAQGGQAADMAMLAMSGVSPRDIPVKPYTEADWIFDDRALKRFKIDPAKLPEGATFVHAPPPFIAVDKGVLQAITVAFAVMAVLLLSLSRNVSRRKRAEETYLRTQHDLTASQGMLRSVLDSIPQLVYWKDASGRFVGVNKSFADFFRLGNPESAAGRRVGDVVTRKSDARRAEEADREVYVTCAPMRGLVWELITPAGDPVMLSVSKTPLFDQYGRITGVLSTAEDITSRISLERQLLRSQKMEALGTFASGIVHDFNNFLTTIMNSAELALMELPYNCEAAYDIRRALTAAEQGARLVSQIHATGRPSQEHMEPTVLADVVHEACGLIRASLPGNIQLRTQVADDLLPIAADPTQIHQIVMNLCGNAFQAMKGKSGHIAVGLARVGLGEQEALHLELPPGPYLALSVADNGPGVPMNIADKIFDPFFTTKGKGKGTGLGLAMVAGIARGHGGAVELNSTPGQGATFTIYLPYRPVKQTPQPAQLPEETGQAMGHERVLFVEDNSEQLATIPRALTRLGFTVVACKGAREAMDRIASDPLPFDCVVSDYDMPETSGVELAQTLEQIDPDLPIILVSGRKSAAQAAKDAGNIKNVLFKPYTGQALSRAIRNLF